MLDKSNHRGWANSLRLEAQPNRQKEDKKWRMRGRWRGGEGKMEGEGEGEREGRWRGEEHC